MIYSIFNYSTFYDNFYNFLLVPVFYFIIVNNIDALYGFSNNRTVSSQKYSSLFSEVCIFLLVLLLPPVPKYNILFS